MQKQVLDIAGNLERLERMAKNAAATMHSQQSTPRSEVVREPFSVLPPPYQPLTLGQAATPPNAPTTHITVTQIQSTPEMTSDTETKLLGSAGAPIQIPYNPLGSYNPLAAPSPTNAYKNSTPESFRTNIQASPAGPSYLNEELSTSTTYNPLQHSELKDADAQAMPSVDFAKSHPAPPHHHYPPGNPAAYNPLQQHVRSTLIPESVPFRFSSPNPAAPTRVPHEQQPPSAGSSAFVSPVPVPVPVLFPLPAESNSSSQLTALNPQLLTPIRFQVPPAQLGPSFPEFHDGPKDEASDGVRAHAHAAPGCLPWNATPPPPGTSADAEMIQRISESQNRIPGAGEAEAQEQQPNLHQGPGQPMDVEIMRRQIEFLHEMVGGRADVATCRDVLEAVGGDVERASHLMLEMYGGGGGVGSSSAAVTRRRSSSNSSSSTRDAVTAAPAGAYSERLTSPHDLGGLSLNADLSLCATEIEQFNDYGSDYFADQSRTGAVGQLSPLVHQRQHHHHHQQGQLHQWESSDEDTAGSRSSGTEDASDTDDNWTLAMQPEEDAAEEKMDELRIYFPNLDEETLRTHLKCFNGDVQQALQLLSELHEDEIYRRIEMERQAESDAELARKLAQQHTMGSPGVTVSAAEDLGSQMRPSEMSSKGGVPAITTASDRDSNSLGPSSAHWGLRLLVHIFGDELDEDLLAEVLENEGGHVDAARAVLRSMGLTEQQQPHRQMMRPPVRGGAPSSNTARPWVEDPWVWCDESAIANGSAELSVDDLRPSLASCRYSPLEAVSDVSVAAVDGGLPARAPSGSSLNSVGAGPSRAAGFPLQSHRQPGSSGLALNRPGEGAQQLLQPNVGPIRLLASLGVDFQELGFSEEALQCIRVAFHNSPLPLLLQRNEASSLQEVLERQRLGLGRPDRGLTHEEKQALWAQHRELPLALKGMQDVLRRGAQAAYQMATADSKRLAAELRRAAAALNDVIKEQHRKASALIYADMNAALRQQWKTDLHAQLPTEVPVHLDRVFRNLKDMGGNVDWLIITGKGLHSRADGPKLPAIVEDWLASHSLEGVPQPGAVLVRLTAEVLARVGAGE